MLATIYVLANRQQVRFDREVALFSQLEQSAQKLRSVQNDLESWIFRAKSSEVRVGTLEDQLDIASTSTQEALLVTEQAITQKEELLQEQIKFQKLQNRLKRRADGDVLRLRCAILECGQKTKKQHQQKNPPSTR